MCGITGIFSPNRTTRSHYTATIRSMADALAHRGPDDSGVWVDERMGIALGHRRLAILDLSPLGRQPMQSRCGRFILCHNGEVYNHLELRSELEDMGHFFSGTSDTETILAAIAQWGIRSAVERFVGMFAFAVWDTHEQRLYLVRDRLGIKPLFYGRAKHDFVFGSELKALKAHPEFIPDIDRDSLALYFRHNYIPAPNCIYKGVQKLSPGCILTMSPNSSEPTIEQYWDIQKIWSSGATAPLDMDETEGIESLETTLAQAVSHRLLSDVPLGVFLSGGIDSSLVAALAQQASTTPVNTFSIGFKEAAYNEATYAKQVATHLGTNHTELYVTPRDLLDTLPLIPKYWDEPFADSSQIPTYCLCRLTRKHVTVALSGDGGDELFSGYTRYHAITAAWKKISSIPLPLRKLIARGGQAFPQAIWHMAGPMGPKIHWRLGALTCSDFESFYQYLVSHNQAPAQFVGAQAEPLTHFTRPDSRQLRSRLDRYQGMSLLDLQTYLPDDILTKVDRASMGVALEARVPLLDHRVVELAARIPTAWKVSGCQGKQILKQILYRHIPRHLVDRPKMGFAVPIDRWMKNELREWCESMLDYQTIRTQGYLDADHVRHMWREYLAGQRNWFSHIWDVLMFQAWLEETR